MARTTVGRLVFRIRSPEHPIVALERYRQQALGGVPAIMAASENRVFEAVKANTPMDTGHMREKLLKTSDVVPVETEYQVFWRAQEFVGEVNPAGKIIQRFYPADVVLGTRFRAGRDPMTPALQAERPRLIKDLSDHFTRAAR